MDIQCNTFANWCSCVLSDGNPFFNNIIQDLRVDLCDGVLLAALVSKLTQTYVEYVEPNCDEVIIRTVMDTLPCLHICKKHVVWFWVVEQLLFVALQCAQLPWFDQDYARFQSKRRMFACLHHACTVSTSPYKPTV
eukprot:m.263612 g.263612  ORF g.263612 m.263612 type:complete len:136 (+) comp15604_c1_seq3:459-866(+)